jgi:hypothetical protein
MEKKVLTDANGGSNGRYLLDVAASRIVHAIDTVVMPK